MDKNLWLTFLGHPVYLHACCIAVIQRGEPGEIESYLDQTTLIQCFDTAGWVIRPVKMSYPKWSDVSSGTLNLAQPIPRHATHSNVHAVAICLSLCLSVRLLRMKFLVSSEVSSLIRFLIRDIDYIEHNEVQSIVRGRTFIVLGRYTCWHLIWPKSMRGIVRGGRLYT